MIHFSIIIPTTNGQKHLIPLFDSIIGNGFDSSLYEVIVVENGQKSISKELCLSYTSRLNIKYQFVKTVGFSAAEARNVGISLSTGNLIIFFDEDVVLQPDCIKEHLAYHKGEDKQKVVFGLRNNTIKDLAIIKHLNEIEEDYRKDFNSVILNKDRLWNYAYSCNLSVNFCSQKEYFDSNFNTWGNEDQEFVYRLFKIDYEIILGDNCLVYHYTDSNIRSPFLRDKYGLDSDYKDFLLSRLYFLKKHWEDKDLRYFLINDLKHYEFRSSKWVRNNIPNANFDIKSFTKELGKV
jgi:glycosyltransferase involved in cell wall biosynthesis